MALSPRAVRTTVQLQGGSQLFGAVNWHLQPGCRVLRASRESGDLRIASDAKYSVQLQEAGHAAAHTNFLAHPRRNRLNCVSPPALFDIVDSVYGMCVSRAFLLFFFGASCRIRGTVYELTLSCRM